MKSRSVQEFVQGCHLSAGSYFVKGWARMHQQPKRIFRNAFIGLEEKLWS